MILFPNCKINLGLDILERRPDGFHDIETLMLPVTGLCDSVEVVPSSLLRFTTSGHAVDCPPEKNSCLKAYNATRDHYGIGPAHIHLHKAVPFGAGLGSGSSDAAFVIRALDKVFHLGLTDHEMERLAAQTGSDTPFFIKNTPALASGRGEILTPCPVPQLSGKHLIIIKPQVNISTARAYAGVHPQMPQKRIWEILKMDIKHWEGLLKNDFERTIFPQYPILGAVKSLLYDAGALYASMSGSGASVYGIFDRRPSIDGVPEDAFVYQQVIP